MSFPTKIEKFLITDWGGGGESTIEGAELSIGGARATPKVYKLTPLKILFVQSLELNAADINHKEYRE